MDRVDHIKQVGDKLNKVGCGFCPMKWLHETLYLHTGDNHSCYHPKPQHIPLEEIEKDPSALHNTEWKKQQRKTMLEGGPKNVIIVGTLRIEGDHRQNDPSSREWAEPEIENISKMSGNKI